VPAALVAALVLAFVALAFVARVPLRWTLYTAAVALTFAAGAWLHARGTFVPPAQAWLAGLVAVGLRTAFDVGAARASRQHLAQTFGGYVSPQLLRAILSGDVDAGHGRRTMAFMFADLRGFTSWSEARRNDPGAVLAVLNRYYATVTPIIHRHGGTIDNFRGDGIMVMFGAPVPLDDACGAAFAAARQMIVALQRLNETELKAQGLTLEVGMGLAWGDAVYGDLGSDDRKDFTALGDAVNVAARLQDLSKTLGYPVLMTAEFLEHVTERDGIVALGEAPLKGHSPVAIAGWRPDRPAPAPA
jgi:class 3 adenylate cyclase